MSIVLIFKNHWLIIQGGFLNSKIMIRTILMLAIGFIAGVMLGPQIDFHQPEDFNFRNFSLKDIPKFIDYNPQQDNSPQKVVTKVIDGDSIVVEGGKHVELVAIDADEKGGQCYKEAKNTLEQMVLGKEVTLEKTSRNKDKNGNLIRFVKLDGVNINKVLLKEGVAAARFMQGDEFNKTPYVEAEAFAQENGVGCKWRSVDQQD